MKIVQHTKVVERVTSENSCNLIVLASLYYLRDEYISDLEANIKEYRDDRDTKR
jgi:hypothetical protein